MMTNTRSLALGIVIFGCSFALPTGPPISAQPLVLPSFPGAEGFGSTTPGGRGGRVIFVTNLDDAGPGSFRAACDAEGPRKITMRGPSASQAARKLPGPASSRFVTKITLPPLPPGVVEPNPSAPGNDGTTSGCAEICGPVGSANENPKITIPS